MAFFLTLLYILTAFVSPPVLFGPIAEYHVEIIIALLALISSIPAMTGSKILEQPQTRAIIGLCVCVVISISINTWIRGGATALYNFLPVTFTYFLTALNCKTKRHLQLIFAALLLGSLNFFIHGVYDLYTNVSPSLYLYGDEGLRRLRGLGLINDPNDFSQVMVSLVPCMFLLGRRKSPALNAILVGIPVAVLVTGLYLAHSRGAAIGLMAIIILAGRRKIGTVPAIVVAGGLFAGSLAFGWSGGREVSVEAGADRLDAWLVGIEFIKAHPLFGIGNNRFGELNYITAHNSIVVCAAENGILGFICWVLFVFSTIRSGVRITSAKPSAPRAIDAPLLLPDTPKNAWANVLAKSSRSALDTQTPKTAQPSGWKIAAVAEAVPGTGPSDIQRTAQLLVFALTGFLTAGWFLSRALSPWMFMYGGMLVAIKRMAQRDGLVLEDEPFPFLVRWAVIISAGVLVLVYLTLKVRALTGG